MPVLRLSYRAAIGRCRSNDVDVSRGVGALEARLSATSITTTDLVILGQRVGA